MRWTGAPSSTRSSSPKKRLRVCSLSRTFNNLLWAHYAAGFSGLALEVRLRRSPEVHTVKYGGLFAGLNLPDGRLPDDIARSVLTSKFKQWGYERETRILTAGQWYQLAYPVKRVIVGQRMNPSLVEALRIICRERGIRLCRTGIGDEGIDADELESGVAVGSRARQSYHTGAARGPG